MRKLLILFGLAGVAAAVVKKMQGQGTAAWQTATDTGRSSGPESSMSSGTTGSGSSGGTSSSATMSTAAAASSGVETTDDPGGASPDEAVADAVEEPHVPTTPDAPAETVDLDEK